jgi:tetratricopeptide (TPR) repeat protein
MTGKTVKDDFDTDELLALARIELERNDLEGALLKLKKIVDAKDAPAEAVALAARVYAQLGLYDRADKLYQRFLEQHPEAVTERFQLGMTRLDSGKPDKALEVWEALLKEQPAHPPALFYKSLVLAQTGKNADAKKNLDLLLKSIPNDNLYFGRGKELLQALEAGPGGAGQPAVDKGDEGGAKLPGRKVDPYRTEH